jgi:SAM-dependent methyltransferase
MAEQKPAEYFDRLYSSHERYWWRGNNRYDTDPAAHPNSLLTRKLLELIRGRAPGCALDVGAGEGADAIRLAMLGYEVDAVEVSPVAAEKIARFAAEAGVKVNVILADASVFLPSGPYDVVICNGVLHYVADKAGLIDAMKAATAPGGFNVVSAWTTYTRIPPHHNSVPVYCDEEDGVIAASYRDWEETLLRYERDKLDQAHWDLPAHSHSHIKLIARKRGLDFPG